MNSEGGYTRQYRRVWDNPVFRNKQEAAVFTWMKDAAQWKDARISTKFGPVSLEVGELLIAERTLSEDFNLHRNTLRALIQRMSDDGMIEIRGDRCPKAAGTVIWVNVEYDFDAVPVVALPDPRRPALKKKVRQAIYDKTGGLCSYCQTPLSLSAGPDQFHVDHRVPFSKGGTDSIENLVPSCATCNLSKSDKRLGDWARSTKAEII